ncbi:MAG: hypothetical protein Q8S73_14580 [Deltaproteobacteria bacterium]|jgi:hypothetical protein|nr:hypothetical protein [Myxococcales bacterium]MDP3215330.1 hypothetical protein [Deltaproteobacteria bacterium]
MPANQKTWEKITRAELDVLKSNLRSKGLVPPSSDKSTIRGRGVVADCEYTETEQTLKVTIKETPPFVSYNYVFGLLDEEIKKVDR